MKSQKNFVAAVLCILLLSVPSSVQAGNGNNDGKRGDREGKYVGSVSVTIRSDQSSKGDGTIVPSSTQSMPGGGYAWAQAVLSWNYFRMDGIAKTGLSSDVPLIYTLCSQVVQISKDGVSKGGTIEGCVLRTGGGSYAKTKKVYTIPFWATWRLITQHGVSGHGFNWVPSITIFASP